MASSIAEDKIMKETDHYVHAANTTILYLLIRCSEQHCVFGALCNALHVPMLLPIVYSLQIKSRFRKLLKMMLTVNGLCCVRKCTKLILP